MTRFEYNLLRSGTFVGPVSPKMIKIAKAAYFDACRRCKHKERKDGWGDWITFARENSPPPECLEVIGEVEI